MSLHILVFFKHKRLSYHLHSVGKIVAEATTTTNEGCKRHYNRGYDSIPLSPATEYERRHKRIPGGLFNEDGQYKPE